MQESTLFPYDPKLAFRMGGLIVAMLLTLAATACERTPTVEHREAPVARSATDVNDASAAAVVRRDCFTKIVATSNWCVNLEPNSTVEVFAGQYALLVVLGEEGVNFIYLEPYSGTSYIPTIEWCDNPNCDDMAAADFASGFLRLKEGNIILTGKPSDLRTSDRLRKELARWGEKGVREFAVTDPAALEKVAEAKNNFGPDSTIPLEVNWVRLQPEDSDK